MERNLIMLNSRIEAAKKEWAKYGLKINGEVKRHQDEIVELYSLISVPFDANETHRVVVDSRKLTTNIGDGLVDEINAHKYCISFLTELMYQIDDKISKLDSQKKEEPKKQGVASQVRSLLTKDGRIERSEVKKFEAQGNRLGTNDAVIDIASDLDRNIFNLRKSVERIDFELKDLTYGSREYMSLLAKHDQVLATLHNFEVLKREYEQKLNKEKQNETEQPSND